MDDIISFLVFSCGSVNITLKNSANNIVYNLKLIVFRSEEMRNDRWDPRVYIYDVYNNYIHYKTV